LCDKPLSRQEPRRQKTRLALVSAGLDLLAERSIDALAVDEIVERAAVSKGSFFNHFKDKDAFAAAVAADIRARVELEVGRVNEGVTDPARRVTRGVARFVRFALSDPRSARILMRAHAGALDPNHPLNAGVRSDVALGIAAGAFTPPSLEAGVLSVVGLCQILLTAVILQDLDADGARRLTREVLTVLLTGLGVDHHRAGERAAEAAALAHV
jgi:AcrR family transcriptional regulator